MTSHQPPSVESLTGRAIILCCDGTGNIWGNGHDTNVVKLARLIKADESQLLFYDPGVGTTDNFPPIGLWNKTKAYVSRLLGLALAAGIYEDIGKGYEFLIDNYRAGDRIYVFGFSRGAFTARSIAGMVNLYGIVRSGAKQMIPMLVRTYFFPAQESRKGSSDKSRGDIADDIRQHFCDDHGRDAWIYFTGVWDTVASVGGVRGLRITSDKGVQEKRFTHIRHAVSLHECRYKYEPRLYQFSPEDSAQGTRSFKQVWFAGCHSDIGGSYEEAELSDISLRWMIDEVTSVQPALKMKPDEVSGDHLGLAHDEAYEVPFWSLTGLQRRLLPAHTELHPSVLLREQAAALNPKPKTVWKPLLQRGWFWNSFIAALLLQAIAVWRVVSNADVMPSFSLIQDIWRAQSWPIYYASIDKVIPTAAAIIGTWWDFAPILVYPFLCFVVLIHARSRIYANGNGLPGQFDRLVTQWSPLILVLADLCENAATIHWLNSAGAEASWSRQVVLVFSSIKITALAIMGAYLLLALFNGKRRS